jgi:hypothetical protein
VVQLRRVKGRIDDWDKVSPLDVTTQRSTSLSDGNAMRLWYLGIGARWQSVSLLFLLQQKRQTATPLAQAL